MKKQLNGFTLAETLISLGIIGIMAVLVLPGLNTQTRQAATTKAVSRAKVLTESGFTNIFQTAQNKSDKADANSTLSSIRVLDLYTTQPVGINGTFITDSHNLFMVMKNFADIKSVDNYDTTSIKDYTGGNVSDTTLENLQIGKVGKTQAIIMVQDVRQNNIETATEEQVIARIIIDGNGNKTPNRFGKDIFLFGITNDGTLTPAGSRAYHNFDNTVAIDDCNNAPNNGLACASRLMADNWEIRYK